MFDILVIPFLIASALAIHGWRKKSLSPGGAAAAFVVGFLMLAVPLRAFGISLLVFYVTGSRATKCEKDPPFIVVSHFTNSNTSISYTSDGKKLKLTLEEGFHEAGYRSAAQVFCNSFAAFLAALSWSALYAPNSIPWIITRKLELGGVATLSRSRYYAPDEWCPLLPGPDGVSRALIFAALG